MSITVLDRDNGWPEDYSYREIAEKLASIIRAGSTNTPVDEELVRRSSLSILAAALNGHELETPRNRSASYKKNGQALTEVIELCEQLSGLLADLNKQAFEGLLEEGGNADELIEHLDRNKRAAHDARSCLPHNDGPKGAPVKHAAVRFADEAERVFRTVYGTEPTYTTDPTDNSLRGDWPDFLREVFATISWISGSPESQIKRIGRLKEQRLTMSSDTPRPWEYE